MKCCKRQQITSVLQSVETLASVQGSDAENRAAVRFRLKWMCLSSLKSVNASWSRQLPLRLYMLLSGNCMERFF